ncbi:hypothetical protein APA_4660 [Pseudanabaena sp. lw0831]|uniref:DUF1816 domain-containing protein n=1 Tax=Pseudanabaena sp. lw0831 TaxID=1357935 RepID=UPI0019164CF1|nr:DUF1816 domain-containing protein [Pseudanabaena sp. lw0831]GBO56330.1 hypothetical protein APA_4660 [Pseudanabaena sp. lw0831]
MDQPQMSSSVYELGWWIEILTAQPLCLYYFGAFTSHQEVNQLKSGFIEDLLLESATILWVDIRFCQPSHITLTRDALRSHFLLSKKLPHSDLNQALLFDIAA